MPAVSSLSNGGKVKHFIGGMALAIGLACAGCSFRPAGPLQHDSKDVDRDNAEFVRVNLNMGAGDLRIDPGTDKLASATFDYNVAEWKPEVTYSSSAGVGSLTITQPGHSSSHLSNTRNDWNIRLNQGVPLEFHVHMGAGDANLNLGGLTLQRVELEMGAGDLNMDLRGSPKTSYDLKIRGGAGDATINLPDSAGVDGTATGGIGDISVAGLHQDGHRYYNDALGKSNVTIHMDIQAGVGDLHLISGK